MLERLLEEAFNTGEVVHECPDFDTTGEMASHLIGLLYLAGKNERGDFYKNVFAV